MSRTAVVGNYAGALLELASREDAEEAYGGWLSALADTYRGERSFRLFLDTPRVDTSEKKAAVREALGGEAPEPFVRFLLVMMEKRRHRLLPEVDVRYREMLEERRGRVHATITVAGEPGEDLREEITRRLTEVAGREVVPTFRTDRDLLGGVVVRMEDHVMDGSLRRRLADLRRRLLQRDGRPEATSR